MSQKLVTIVYNTAFYVYKFRMNLIEDLLSAGYRVAVISPVDEYVEILRKRGVAHYPISMSQYGMNPLNELRTVFELYRLFKELKPHCSLHYTVKPNTFGSVAGQLAGIPVINNIAGAGRAFSQNRSLLARLVLFLYRIGLRNSHKVFFQNNEDMQLFLDRGAVNSALVERIPGSGVDLKKYSANYTRVDDGVLRFLFVGRLLKEKGIFEFLEAASIVFQQTSCPLKFEIVGELDDSDVCISRRELEVYLLNKQFEYHGTVSPDQMPALMNTADCVVLPSYYGEGVPRSLLEAAALSKPIITTDNVGCRDVVDEGINGFKVPVKDIHALASAILRIIKLTELERCRMGAAGRRKVEDQFDEAIVLNAYRIAVQSI